MTSPPWIFSENFSALLGPPVPKEVDGGFLMKCALNAAMIGLNDETFITQFPNRKLGIELLWQLKTTSIKGSASTS